MEKYLNMTVNQLISRIKELEEGSPSEVTQVNIIRLADTDTEPVRAVVDVIVYNSLLLRNIKVMNGDNGLFVSAPKDPEDPERSIFLPFTRKLREAIEDAVLTKYQDVILDRKALEGNF